MSFPEWGCSYNALYLPLTSDWQCSLVPARDVQDVDRGWKLSYEERQLARKEREERIKQDRQDFDRLFRVSINRRAARACSDFSAYVAFISEHLRISGMATAVDGESVTRVLRDAVRDGSLIPAIDRAWRGSRRVARSYAPQSWPKRVADPKAIVYGVRNGQFVPLDEAGRFIDSTPYLPVAASAGRGGFDWPGAVESATGTVPGDDLGPDDGGDVSEGDVFSTDSGDASTPLGHGQSFEYQPDMPDGDAEELAGTTNEKYARKMFGYDNSTFRDMIHRFKKANGIGPNDDLEFEKNGDVSFNGEYIDNFHGYVD